MRRHYPRGFRDEMILKFESLFPKMRYIDFQKRTIYPLKTWMYDSRKKIPNMGLLRLRQQPLTTLKERIFLSTSHSIQEHFLNAFLIF